jgi:hypothetical protein
MSGTRCAGCGGIRRSPRSSRSRDFAYDLERVIAASIDFRKSSVRTPREIHAIFRTLEERVRRVPQVERTALSAAPVLGSGGGGVRVYAIRRSNQDPGADECPDGGIAGLLRDARAAHRSGSRLDGSRRRGAGRGGE